MMAGALAAAAWIQWSGLMPPASAQTNRQPPSTERTPWGDPDLQGEWTSEGEYGVPLERPPQFATRQFLTDAEYAKRMEEVRLRDARDLARVDVLAGKVDAPNAPTKCNTCANPCESLDPLRNATEKSVRATCGNPGID